MTTKTLKTAAVKTSAKTVAAKQTIAVKTALDDKSLLKMILAMPVADRSSAFKVMITLRKQNVSSSRMRIRRLIAEHVASAPAAKTKAARKST